MAQVKTENIEMFEDTYTANIYKDETKGNGLKMVALICISSVLAGIYLYPIVALIVLAAIVVLLAVVYWAHFISIIIFAVLKRKNK